MPAPSPTRAAMFEVAQNVDRVVDDLMRLAALDVGDEADAAGILFEGGIVKSLGRRTPAELTRGFFLHGSFEQRFVI